MWVRACVWVYEHVCTTVFVCVHVCADVHRSRGASGLQQLWCVWPGLWSASCWWDLWPLVLPCPTQETETKKHPRETQQVWCLTLKNYTTFHLYNSVSEMFLSHNNLLLVWCVPHHFHKVLPVLLMNNRWWDASRHSSPKKNRNSAIIYRSFQSCKSCFFVLLYIK